MSKLLSWGEISVTPNGVKRVMHLPDIAEFVYLHTVFPPALPSDITDLRKFYGELLHADYIEFIKIANGLHMFGGELSLYGYMHCISRDAMRPEPFDVKAPMGYLGKDPIILGSVQVAFYQNDGSALWLHGKTGRVAKRHPKTFTEIGNGWASLEIALLSEYSRLAVEFERSGRKLRPWF